MCCSCRSIELNRVNAFSNIKDFQTTDIGLVCVQCKQFICQHCIKKVQEKLQVIGHDFDPRFEDFVNNIMQYESSCNDLDKDYIGHCCIIKNNKILNNKSSGPKRKVVENINEMSFGGSFCIPEFELMIESCDQCMDVFGIGHDTDQEPLLHYVLDEKCANELKNNGYQPLMDMPSDWITYEMQFEITLPHVIKEHNKKVSECIK